MNLKKAYYYLFYKLYKFWNKNENILLSSNFRAEISIIAIKLWIVFALYGYGFALFKLKPSISITNPIGFVPIILVLGTTLYFFTFSEKWKHYFEEFEQWPREKNAKGGLIVWSLIGFIFINVLITFNLIP
jgi:hypothetical protein